MLLLHVLEIYEMVILAKLQRSVTCKQLSDVQLTTHMKIPSS
jgi:hypothetical protein